MIPSLLLALMMQTQVRPQYIPTGELPGWIAGICADGYAPKCPAWSKLEWRDKKQCVYRCMAPLGAPAKAERKGPAKQWTYTRETCYGDDYNSPAGCPPDTITKAWPVHPDESSVSKKDLGKWIEEHCRVDDWNWMMCMSRKDDDALCIAPSELRLRCEGSGQ